MSEKYYIYDKDASTNIFQEFNTKAEAEQAMKDLMKEDELTQGDIKAIQVIRGVELKIEATPIDYKVKITA